MRKAIAATLAMLLILSSFGTIFANSEVPADVLGTPYESAVRVLYEKGLLNGYDDGTFKPGNTINRAEACVVVVRAMGATASELGAAADNGFTDMSGYAWARTAINFASDNGIVSGYGNGTFRPDADITYAEFAAMLLNALGEKAADLAGYYAKAVDLGMFTGLSPAVETLEAASAPALRGNVVIMAESVAEAIAEAYEQSKSETEQKDDQEENESGSDTESGGAETDKDKDADKDTEGNSNTNSNVTDLSDYSGRIYAVILDTGTTVNSKGETVDQVKILFGTQTVYLNTNGNPDLPSEDEYLSGKLYCFRLSNGAIRNIADNGSDLGSKNYDEITGDDFVEVVDKDGRYVTVDLGSESNFHVNSDASIYTMEFDSNGPSGYKRGSFSDVAKGAYIRAYDVSDQNPGIADVVIVVKKSDLSKFGL